MTNNTELILERLDNLGENIDGLSFEKALLFGLICCQRLVPNFQFFSENENFGTDIPLLQSIRIALEICKGKHIETSKIEKLKTEILEIIPNYEEVYGSKFSMFAISTCGSIDNLLNFILRKDFQEIKGISEGSFNTVDDFVKTKNNTDDELPEDELIVRELKFQKELINHLMTSNISDSIEKFYQTDYSNLSNIDIFSLRYTIDNSIEYL